MYFVLHQNKKCSGPPLICRMYWVWHTDVVYMPPLATTLTEVDAGFKPYKLRLIQTAQMCFVSTPVSLIQGYYKWFIRFQNAILSKVLHVQIRLIYETNRKLTKFVMGAPVGSTSSVPLDNGDKARKEFLCVGICEMLLCCSSTTHIQKRGLKRTAM
jgi:hypothetical protein